MNDYLKLANSGILYLIVMAVLLFIAACCFIFIIKSYRAGMKIGMDRKVLRKAITSSALFTVLPAVSILLGVIALSGSLGVPISWFRLSVVGNLQYEAIAAEAASQAMGMELKADSLNIDALMTIVMVMTTGICFGCLFSVLFLKRYSGACRSKTGVKKEGKSFADWAMVAMFIGMCATFIGSYIARLVNSSLSDFVPIATAAIAALTMAVLEYLARKKSIKALESFSLALSMLIAMAAAAIVSL